jgi:choline kinase
MKWIKKEKNRRAAHKGRSRTGRESAHAAPPGEIDPAVIAGTEAEGHSAGGSSRRASDEDSEGSIALELLQEILEHNMSLLDKQPLPTSRSHLSLRRLGSLRKLRRQSVIPPDAEINDGEFFVPSCDVLLDNSKTLSYFGGLPAESEDNPNKRQLLRRTTSTREKDAWKTFKYEIVRLAHTLKLKSWRRVPLEWSDKIVVERLSGALTNAVYVVSPPVDTPRTTEDGQPKAPVPKLLLRIYGSQVDHLIDRESELQILRRLARKHIGPRLLGTFTNGRFEEFFNARTLTAPDLRIPNTARQIAKRMRELHDGVELLDSEIAAGPFVWQNIDKWMARCEKVVQWIEATLAKGDDKARALNFDSHVVVADFKLFKVALERYRTWLNDLYGGPDGVRARLVFAHNDVRTALRTKLSSLTQCIRPNMVISFNWFRTAHHHYFFQSTNTSDSLS